MASALSALAGTLRGKFSNRQGHSKGAFPLTSKRGPRDFYKGKGAKSTGTLTKKGACMHVRVRAPAPRGTCQTLLRSPMHRKGPASVNSPTKFASGSGPLRENRRAEPLVSSCAFSGCADQRVRATEAALGLPCSCVHVSLRHRVALPCVAGALTSQRWPQASLLCSPTSSRSLLCPIWKDVRCVPLLQAKMGSLLSLPAPSPVLECSSYTGRLDAVETVRGLQHAETQAS